MDSSYKGEYPGPREFPVPMAADFASAALEMCPPELNASELKFRFRYKPGESLHHLEGCWGPGFVEVRLGLTELTTAKLCHCCQGRFLLHKDSSLELRILVTALSFAAITQDEDSKDPGASRDPLRIPNLDISVGRFMRYLVILQEEAQGSTAYAETFLAGMHSSLMQLRVRFKNFARSSLAREQLIRKLLELEPEEPMPLKGRTDFFLIISQEHIDILDWNQGYSKGYLDAFEVQREKESKFLLVKAPEAVITTLCEIFLIEDTSIAALPEDDEEIIETALGVATSDEDGPLGTTEGAFKTARALRG